MEDSAGRATRIELFSFSTRPMRAFHLAWLAFFSVFFAWFGVAPLMPVVREDLGLSQEEVGNTIIASVAATVLVRILIGPICDRFGARRAYAALLVLGSIPVMTIGLAHSYEAFLLFRVAIGAIGAAFVITQYHTTVMFAPNCVGTANATTAGWGNLGGGMTQIVMPLVLAGFLALGFTEGASWRLAMVAPGLAMLVLGVAYYHLTEDTPSGAHPPASASATEPGRSRRSIRTHWLPVLRDSRVWVLFVLYAACFGVELTINNVAALYFHDTFALDLKTAGLVAGLFGLMNIFARTLGGYLSDRTALRWGLLGRARLLFAIVLLEGLAVMLFSRMTVLPLAIVTLCVFSLFVQAAEGATFGVVPFVQRKALGIVAGIVGAGGNLGAVAAGFLFRSEALAGDRAFFHLGVLIAFASFAALALRFPDKASPVAADEGARSYTEERPRRRLGAARRPAPV